jgi:hypothetical protein
MVRIKNSFSRLHFFALFLYLVFITIGFSTSNTISRLYIEPIRLVSAIGIVLLTFLSVVGFLFLYRSTIDRRLVITAALYLCILIYGIFLSVINDGFRNIMYLVSNFLIVMCGVFLFSLAPNGIISKKVTTYFLFYVVSSFVVAIAFGGFVLEYPPHFNFDYNPYGADEILYSQGISRFFGLGSISAVFLAYHGQNRSSRILLYSIALALLVISLLGGARGDSVAAVIVLFGYMMQKKPKLLFAWITVGIIFYFIKLNEISFDDFLIVNRLFSSHDKFGLRDILFWQSINLLGNEPICLVFGCGFGYFQTYYGYEAGMYPHNLITETLISFGLPISVFLSCLIICGIIIYNRTKDGNDAFFLFFFYELLVSMKSGSILGDWIVVCGGLYFSSISISYFLNLLNNSVLGLGLFFPVTRKSQRLNAICRKSASIQETFEK